MEIIALRYADKNVRALGLICLLTSPIWLIIPAANFMVYLLNITSASVTDPILVCSAIRCMIGSPTGLLLPAIFQIVQTVVLIMVCFAALDENLVIDKYYIRLPALFGPGKRITWQEIAKITCYKDQQDRACALIIIANNGDKYVLKARNFKSNDFERFVDATRSYCCPTVEFAYKLT